jgi:hypothetical protein
VKEGGPVSHTYLLAQVEHVLEREGSWQLTSGTQFSLLSHGHICEKTQRKNSYKTQSKN